MLSQLALNGRWTLLRGAFNCHVFAFCALFGFSLLALFACPRGMAAEDDSGCEILLFDAIHGPSLATARAAEIRELRRELQLNGPDATLAKSVRLKFFLDQLLGEFNLLNKAKMNRGYMILSQSPKVSIEHPEVIKARLVELLSKDGVDLKSTLSIVPKLLFWQSMPALQSVDFEASVDKNIQLLKVAQRSWALAMKYALLVPVRDFSDEEDLHLYWRLGFLPLRIPHFKDSLNTLAVYSRELERAERMSDMIARVHELRLESEFWSMDRFMTKLGRSTLAHYEFNIRQFYRRLDQILVEEKGKSRRDFLKNIIGYAFQHMDSFAVAELVYWTNKSKLKLSKDQLAKKKIWRDTIVSQLKYELFDESRPWNQGHANQVIPSSWSYLTRLERNQRSLVWLNEAIEKLFGDSSTLQ